MNYIYIPHDITKTSFHVRYKNTKEIIHTFNSRTEANYYITDVFGPEWNTVEIHEE